MIKKHMYFIILILSTSIILLIISCSDDSSDEPTTLPAPILLEATAITTASFNISWIGSTVATQYLIDVATDDQFSTLLSNYNQFVITSESLQVTGLEDDTRYYVRLTASDGTITSEFSNMRSATTEFEFVPEPEPEVFLRDTAKFPVGVALQAGRLNGAYASRVSNEFSSITGEFEMKMSPIFQAEGSYNFTPGDALVSFAEANDMQVHGHALVWHNAVPSFVQNFSGSDEEFEQLIRTYIHDVVNHYKGKIISWDVVNEAFDDNGGNLRNSVFRQKLGDDYLAKCFQWAREADPDILLFYNDYNLFFDNSKLNAALAMVADFQQRGIPIDGFGFQAHIGINFPSETQIRSAVDKVVATGLQVHFSEVDIRINPNNDLTMPSSSRLQAQRAKYKEVVEIFSKIPKEQQFAITIWGLIDSQTWLIDFWGQPEWPLMFNNDLSPKPAHTGFAEGLME